MKRLLLLYLLLIIVENLDAQVDLYRPIDLDTVNYSLGDFGRMWTFDDIPVEMFKNKYGFNPTPEWLEKVQRAALQFGGGCSAAFVSANGLIMTNHHCGRGQLSSIQDEGENWLRDGFYAEELEDERKVPNLFVDQLISITDVTREIQSAMDLGNTSNERITIRDSIKSNLVKRYENKFGLTCKVITLYNGGKYSLYAYKRYNDIRLVMAPDFQIAATGWDWDNFTYPRYELDFMFYRAYTEDGKPVESPDHFRWSKKGAEDGEPIFVVGRPGHTDRLLSVVQLEYLRDVRYQQSLRRYDERYKVYFEIFKTHPERESELLNNVMRSGNGRKSYAGRLFGLRKPYLMKKKYDFECSLKEKVKNDSTLNQSYGNLWDSLNTVIEELRSTADEYYGYAHPRSNPYFEIAKRIIQYAEEIQKPEEERSVLYQADIIDHTKESVFPKKFDKELSDKLVRAHANVVSVNLGRDNKYLYNLYGGKVGNEAADIAISKSLITSRDNVDTLLNKSPEEILSCGDPFISFILNTRSRYEEITSIRKEAENKLALLNQKLGAVIFKIYGSAIPPDATSSLRISDGVIKGYEYNGTIAPGRTTFYGLWDRYYSFGKESYPWGLHERWQEIPDDLDLSIPIGLASTNDIVGGNSGSSLINSKMEVVGLAHDGNLESLGGHFIYDLENNRTVSTDSWGLIESLKHIYETDRLVEELLESGLD